jgi:hypothetical protein
MTDQDLIAFLRERFDEEEAAAKLVPRPYRLYINSEGVMAEPAVNGWPEGDGEYQKDADGNDVLPNQRNPYALLYDPDKTLREIAAKRKLLDRFRRAVTLRSHSGGKKVGDKYYAALGPVLEVLAAAYSDHPGYRSNWIED